MSSLNEAGVEYLLVGGYAVGYHGFARATGDIDIWVRPTEENADRVVRAIRAFGFDSDAVQRTRFLGNGKITRMGLPPNRIEVMTSISGVTFEACWADREVSEWDGVRVPTLSLRDLRANKRASGRPKDLADLDELPDPSDD